VWPYSRQNKEEERSHFAGREEKRRRASVGMTVFCLWMVAAVVQNNALVNDKDAF
jgi:hypothetical protein